LFVYFCCEWKEKKRNKIILNEKGNFTFLGNKNLNGTFFWKTKKGEKKKKKKKFLKKKFEEIST